jgi:hypothetical protein
MERTAGNILSDQGKVLPVLKAYKEVGILIRTASVV